MDQRKYMIRKIENLDLFHIRDKNPRYVLRPEKADMPEYKFLPDLCNEVRIESTQKDRTMLMDLITELDRYGVLADWAERNGARLNRISSEYCGMSI